MVSLESLLDHFQITDSKSSEKIINKCIDLCNSFKLGVEELHDRWTAYALSNQIDSEPTLDTLDGFERKDLTKNVNNTPLKKPSRGVTNICTPRDSPRLNQNPVPNVVLSTTPKSSKALKRPLLSPGDTLSKKPLLGNVDPVPNDFLLDSKKNEITSVDVLRSYGTSNNWSQSGHQSIFIKSVNNQTLDTFSADYMIGDCEIADIYNEQTNTILQDVIKKGNLNNEETVLDFLHGRICMGFKANKFDIDSVDILVKAKRYTLDVRELTEFCAYPGQVAAACGTLRSTTLTVTKYHSDASLLLPSNVLSIKKPLQIVVAAGPFTNGDNLMLDFLDDIVSYVLEYKPDVFVLVGPFMDENNGVISECKVGCTFDNYFNNLVNGIVNRLQNVPTQIVLVASCKDVNALPFYPTPPYKTNTNHSRLTLMPDPCIININGVVLATTSIDVMKHLKASEIRVPSNCTEVPGRYASHLISQHNMYPIYPPDKELPFNMKLWREYCNFRETPHVLVLPSELDSFVTNIEDCVVVNPQTLDKSNGAFVRIQVRPVVDGTSVSANTVCEIVKISR